MAEESDASQLPGGTERSVRVSALEHPMVLGVLARMASNGAWQRIIDEQPLSEGVDVVDAEFLVAAGAVTRIGDTRFRLAVDEPIYRDPEAVASSALYQLRRALEHASGRVSGWADADPETVIAFGRVTGRGGDIIADQLLPRLPALETRFREGDAAFLDIGVGVGAISIRLVERYPGTHAVGLDVLPGVLELAQAEVARNGLLGSIELRLQSIADLHDQNRYDLAWIPQPFIGRDAFFDGIHNVFRALTPGGALLVPVALHADAPEFARARVIHSALLAGGSTIAPSELVQLLHEAGFEDLTEHALGAQVLMTAIKPPAAIR
jgi:SAM-dependent methyltransferase